MEFKDLQQKAIDNKNRYHLLEEKKYGRRWTTSQIMQGFVVDVGELMQLVMAKEGIRDDHGDDLDAEVAHELSDCLYSVFVLAYKLGVDLESTYMSAMEKLESRIGREMPKEE